VIVFVEPGAMTRGDRLRDVPSAPPAAATVVIGPEGGWTLEEIAQWAGTFRLVTLSGPTLRADAMPLAALSALLTSWGEL
jgi:RsmE family RNA methyltransferase